MAVEFIQLVDLVFQKSPLAIPNWSRALNELKLPSEDGRCQFYVTSELPNRGLRLWRERKPCDFELVSKHD